MAQNCKDKNYSPVPLHSPHHGPGNLTGHHRKIKDLAADFHNYIVKWEAYNSQGMDIVTQIANIKIEKVYHAQVEDGTPIKSLPDELNVLCNSLEKIIDAMSILESKLHLKAKNAEALVALEKFPKSEPGDSQILFATMTLRDVADLTREICSDYQKELQLKRRLLGEVAHTASQEESQALAACWLHQPYVRPQTWDLVQALLKETGHVK